MISMWQCGRINYKRTSDVFSLHQNIFTRILDIVRLLMPSIWLKLVSRIHKILTPSKCVNIKEDAIVKHMLIITLMIARKTSLLIHGQDTSKICIKYTTQVCHVDKHAQQTIHRADITSALYKTEQKDATKQMPESC